MTRRFAWTSGLALTLGMLSSQFAAAGDTAAGGEDPSSPAAPATPAPDAASQEASAKYSRVLPFMAQQALDSGHELPLPFGGALIVTGLYNRTIDVSDVRVGLQNPAESVSEFAQFGAKSNVFNANLKFDAWLLPFLNVYALLGTVKNESTTHIQVRITPPGLPGLPPPAPIEFAGTVETDLSGVVGGAGMTLAAGYGPFFIVADVNYIQSDLGFDERFKGKIATVRTGYQGKLSGLPLQLWFGVGNWHTATTVSSSVEIPGAGLLTFEADQAPHTPWMYDVGANVEINKKWQLVADVGNDLVGGWVFVIGPTYRF